MRAWEASFAIHGVLMAACLMVAGLCGPGDSKDDSVQATALIGFTVEPRVPKQVQKKVLLQGTSKPASSNVMIFSCYVGTNEDH